VTALETTLAGLDAMTDEQVITWARDHDLDMRPNATIADVRALCALHAIETLGAHHSEGGE